NMEAEVERRVALRLAGPEPKPVETPVERRSLITPSPSPLITNPGSEGFEKSPGTESGYCTRARSISAAALITCVPEATKLGLPRRLNALLRTYSWELTTNPQK